MLSEITSIFQIPVDCLVNMKITKAFFKRNFELSLSEKKLLDDFTTVIQIDWLASFKPDNANMASVNTEQAVFEEIQIIAVQTSENNFDKNKLRIAELIQKYIPYHTLLCIYNSADCMFNTCDKRINQNDSTKRTIEKFYFSENISFSNPSPKQNLFLKCLNFPNLDKHNLKTFYDSYTTRIIALSAADITGNFIVRLTERSKNDVRYIEKITQLNAEILTLQNQAVKESQLNLQVQLNAEIQQRRKEIRELEDIITKN